MSHPTTDDPVARAVRDLQVFHPDALDEVSVRGVLQLWSGYHDLSAAQVEAVVAHFVYRGSDLSSAAVRFLGRVDAILSHPGSTEEPAELVARLRAAYAEVIPAALWAPCAHGGTVPAPAERDGGAS